MILGFLKTPLSQLLLVQDVLQAPAILPALLQSVTFFLVLGSPDWTQEPCHGPVLGQTHLNCSFPHPPQRDEGTEEGTVAAYYIILPKNSLCSLFSASPLVPSTFIILCAHLYILLPFLLVRLKLYPATSGELKIFILCVIYHPLSGPEGLPLPAAPWMSWSSPQDKAELWAVPEEMCWSVQDTAVLWAVQGWGCAGCAGPWSGSVPAEHPQSGSHRWTPWIVISWSAAQEDGHSALLPCTRGLSHHPLQPLSTFCLRNHGEGVSGSSGGPAFPVPADGHLQSVLMAGSQ